MKSHKIYTKPDLYEKAFSWDPFIEARYLLSIFKKHSGKTLTRIMDIGCGTGRVSGLLEKAGYDVFSFDLALEMIRYSRTRRGLDAIVSDARKIPARSEIVKLAFSLLSTLNYFGNSEDFLNHFREVRRVLRRNGIYVADMVIEQPPAMVSASLGKLM